MLRFFVANLPFTATETTLVQFFESEGYAVGDSEIKYDRITGNSKGFGFIDIKAKSHNEVIEAMSGRRMGGRLIAVREAHPRPVRTLQSA